MERTWKPTVAGILDIVAGDLSFVGLIFAFFGILALKATGGIDQSMGIQATMMLTIMAVVAIFAIIVDVLAIIGGIYALQRRRWGLALTGSIAAFLASWPLGIAAIVFTAVSKNEFE